MRKWALFGIFLLTQSFLSPLYSQINDPQSISGGFAAGMHGTSRGLGIELELAKGPMQRQFLYGLSLHQLKDLREVQIESFFGDQGRSYVYGKLNHFVVLQPSFGIQYHLIPKSHLNVMQILGGIKIGPSIGFLNPYFLEIYLPGPNPGNQNRDIVPFNPAEHTYGRIYGRASLVSSRLELSPVIGMGIKAHALIDFGRNTRNISALKLGVNLDAFAKQVPILQERDGIDNNRLFFAVSAGLLFGRRW
ncbi:MAG: hypothetical protein AAF587_23375 [Bacteroidota bacterium]